MTDFNTYNDLLVRLGDEVDMYRRLHGGRVPKELFEKIFPLAGQYESFGAIIEVQGQGIAFVLRDKDMGAHWNGRFQLPCMAVTPGESDSDLLDRLASSEFCLSAETWATYKHDVVFLPGRTVQWEGERKARCRTRRVYLEVASLDGFGGKWKIVSRDELEEYVHMYDHRVSDSYELIDHMVAACLWYYDPDRLRNPNADVDVRKYISTMFDPYPMR